MKTKSKKTVLYLLLAFFILLDLSFQTFAQNVLGVYASPVVWLIGALGTCWVALKLFTNGHEVDYSFQLSDISKRRLFAAGILILCSIVTALLLKPNFEAYPIDSKISDIIPSIEFYVKRLLAGEKVYTPMDFGGWTVLPTYLPLLWLPYCFAEILDFDYRWTAYGVFLLAIIFYNFKLLKQEQSLPVFIFKCFVPFIFLLTLVLATGPNFGMAVELLPSGFYLILCLTVLNRSVWVMGLGILLCLMSRYAFTFWLPIYFFVIWMDRSFFISFKTGLVALLGVTLIYIIPFFAKDPSILTNGLQYYAKTAEGQWKTQTWQQPEEKPGHLFRGLSLASYFYDFADGDPPDRLKKNRKVHLLACGIAALLILLGYFYYRPTGIDPRIYMIIALKFYLSIFYGFFYVPFSYLFMLPLFLTIPILYELSFDFKRT